MSSKIVNLAARHLGSGEEISNFETERSEMARAARAFYDIARDETLKDANLPMMRRRAKLAIVGEDATNGYYIFKYRYPADCLAIRGVFNPTYVAIENLPGYAYQLSSDDQGILVLSSINSLEVQYTHLITHVDYYPADLIMAISYKLAAYMAPSTTKGDPFGLGPKNLQLYEIAIDKVKANSYNEESTSGYVHSELADSIYIDKGYMISGRNDNIGGV